ncbi:MAG: hypothetical protein M0C28_20115 [Candidatus Moduliflexus flocculans]|nr:hypothetical protein [Candidatus Moduliflexus flocculans]
MMAGQPYYMAGPNVPTDATNYTLYRKSDASKSYMGIDLVLNKRLSNKWFANASFTWQSLKSYWGNDYFDPTNYDAFNGKPYGDWGGGASGKLAVLMYTRWMAKVSGLYQLPLGFDISGTFNAREGWRIPNYYWLYDDRRPEPRRRPVGRHLSHRLSQGRPAHILERHDAHREEDQHRDGPPVPHGRLLQHLQLGHREPVLREVLRRRLHGQRRRSGPAPRRHQLGLRQQRHHQRDPQPPHLEIRGPVRVLRSRRRSRSTHSTQKHESPPRPSPGRAFSFPGPGHLTIGPGLR